MTTTVSSSTTAPLRTRMVGGWKLHEYDSVDSTNLVAAGLSEWSAVRADCQSAGRGRFQRKWVSDAGGLWLSAVLPTPAEAKATPLAVGLAVCEALADILNSSTRHNEANTAELRMRWPNDVLIGDRKLAGLLLDQFTPGLVVAGIGINATNQPEVCDGSLKNCTARLADLVSPPPGLSELAERILVQLRAVWNELTESSFQHILPRINALWGAPRTVELDLDGRLECGIFTNVDTQGRLMLEHAGQASAFEPIQVRHLREL